MAKEIERRFLVDESSLSNKYNHINYINQGYLIKPGESTTVRVRISLLNSIGVEHDSKIINAGSYLTIKIQESYGSVDEFEYRIPIGDAKKLLLECDKVISKFRYVYKYDKYIIELDKFEKDLSGIIIAEVELDDINKEFPMPPYFTHEVTGIRELSNFSMINNPDRAKEIIKQIKFGAYELPSTNYRKENVHTSKN